MGKMSKFVDIQYYVVYKKWTVTITVTH